MFRTRLRWPWPRRRSTRSLTLEYEDDGSSSDHSPRQDDDGIADRLTDQDFVICQGLVKIYQVDDLETVALQGLDLLVQRGEMVAIVGASGSGKSTLLNVIGGLDRPSAGRIVVGARDLMRLSDDQLAAYRRTQVGFVWQESGRNLIPYLPAGENIMLPMLLADVPPGERESWAAELLDAVALDTRASHVPGALSGGEQQRVAIAVAMANRPRLLLADEPTGELDSATAAQVYAFLRYLNERYGTTIIIVSHDPRIASQVHRVVAMRDGKISSETRRVSRADETVDEELVVLDAALRLQIPATLAEQLGLGDRVRVEIEGDHIAIRPAARDSHGSAEQSRK